MSSEYYEVVYFGNFYDGMVGKLIGINEVETRLEGKLVDVIKEYTLCFPEISQAITFYEEQVEFYDKC